jgi:AcrR family transcriptional regulator
MSWSRHDGPRGYHHGNLKEALIRAALELIAKKGPAGFTFAEAARFAGVSPAAPYRHFRDRDELLADVARRGFEEFAIRLERAWNGGAPEPFAAFERSARPIWSSLARSPRITRRCSKRVCRRTSAPNWRPPATVPSR